MQEQKYSFHFCLVGKLFLPNGLNTIEMSFVFIGARPLSNHFYVFFRFGSLLIDRTTLVQNNVKLRTVGTESERMYNGQKGTYAYVNCSISISPMWSQCLRLAK
jgi:hypothetical protein